MAKRKTSQETRRSSDSGWLRSRLRIGCAGLLGCVLALALISLDSVPVPARHSVEAESAATIAARADAAVALRALQGGDLSTLSEVLADRRADPAFAYFFTALASPQQLGDVLGTVAAADGIGLSDDVDPTAYDEVLTDLADTLSLATQDNGGEFALPATWAENFATYMTKPAELSGENVDADRAEQDQANRQNLLLLLSRGRWGTQFLMTVTRAFWEWEHDPSADGDPWPGVPAFFVPGDGPVPHFAPAPNGVYITDGMVALAAALTSSPEAAGWAFVDFQPGTDNVSIDGDDHQMGKFAHYLFFERTDSGVANPDEAGSTALTTALLSAVKATGGSYVEDSVGPRADAYILEDYQAALAEEAERRGSVWYRQVGRTVLTLGQFLQDHGHSILDVISALPVAGAPADVANGVWFAVEGDWSAAGLSTAGMVPLFGDAVVVAVKANKAVKLIKRGVGATERIAAADDLPKGATNLGDDVLQFENTDDFLAALDEPSPGLTYQIGETTYRAAPDGKSVTRVGGPDRTTLGRSDSVKTIETRARINPVSVLLSPRALARNAERQGLLDVEVRLKVSVNAEQVLAHVGGLVSGRFFDGVVLKPDGTYEAIDVLYGDEEQSSTQISFDRGIGLESPALATLKLGETVKITSVVVVRVTP